MTRRRPVNGRLVQCKIGLSPHEIDLPSAQHGTGGKPLFLNEVDMLAVNQGGEVHTFAGVEEFGGGFIPDLNTLSGTQCCLHPWMRTVVTARE